ncbi:MAG: hypothetical protein EBU08_09095 [Micrococcales bacterium]|nr:hypothetical protein [Micrococcales bacterium]
MSQTEELFQRLLKETSEPLHPDLVPYFEADGALGAQVRHPLVYQVPLWSNGSANAYYLQKKRDLEIALAEKNFSRVIYLHERPYRLQAFIQIAHHLSDEKYWSLLASVWTDTENAWQNLDEWRKLFNSSRPKRQRLMDRDEVLAYDNLPDTVKVYRGCQKGINEDGISWTLKRDKAEWFATRFSKDGLVLEKEIQKKDIIAVFTNRNEYEVII